MKLTEKEVEDLVVDAQYNTWDRRLTVCVITLKNGFLLTGESACIDPANYNETMGNELAKADAMRKIWMVEGYLRRTIFVHGLDRLSEETSARVAAIAGKLLNHPDPEVRTLAASTLTQAPNKS